MNVIEIPFAQTVGIIESDNGLLMLNMGISVSNHIGSIHASAQFTLAETASGKLLLESFPELEGKVVPLLRDSKIKFKRPAETAITATAIISIEDKESLLKQLNSRGRGSIEILVEIKDVNNKVTCSGVFNWYIQNIV